jgi:hypothetical protein
MPADEKTRLRIRQRLIELMDEQAADAMMESMPPIPWTDLATKDDIAQLTARMGGIDTRLDNFSDSVDDRFDRVDAQFDRLNAQFGNLSDSVDTRFDTVGTRLDSLGMRMDTLGVNMNELGRAVTIGAATMAVMLVVFIVGTIASLVAAGAFG